MSGFKLAPSRLNRPPASDDAAASPATKTNFIGEFNFLNPASQVIWWNWSGLTASKLGLLAEPKLTPSSGAIQAKSSNGDAVDSAEVRKDCDLHKCLNEIIASQRLQQIQWPPPLILRALPCQAVSLRPPLPSASLHWPSQWTKLAKRRSESKMKRKLVKISKLITDAHQIVHSYQLFLLQLMVVSRG